MNIFFLNSIEPLAWGGGEKWMLMAANGLRARGHNIYFSGRKDSLFLRNCSEAGFTVFPLQIKSDFGLINICKISRFLNKNNIELIITNFNKETRLAGIAKKFSGVKNLIVRNGLPILPNNLRHRLLFPRLANGMITPNRAIKEKYLTYGWIDSDFIKVIHNGVDFILPEKIDRNKILQKYNLPDQMPILGMFARLVGQKKHTIFLDSAKKVFSKWPTAEFLIVGDGPLRNNLEEYAAKIGISKHIKFLGHQKEVMELYSICDVIVHTSIREGLPNAILEAMYAGKPVVAFNSGGTDELIVSDKVGVLIPQNNTDLLIEKIFELLEDKKKREEMGREAHNFVINNFSVEKMVGKVEDYIFSLVDEKKN